jgi:Domain of unknown function (DUF4845)
MNSVARQFGASFFFWLFLIGILGFAGVMGLRIIPVYINSYTVDKILEEVVAESRTKTMSKNQIWSSIKKRLDINNIRNIRKENFEFKRERGKIVITLKYEVRTKLMGNLDGIASFEKTHSVSSDG